MWCKSFFNIGRVTARDDGAARRRSAITTRRPAATRSIAGGGGAVRQKHEMAGILDLPPDKVRVLSLRRRRQFRFAQPSPMSNSAWCVWAARKLKRPVKYTATRSEAFLTDYQGRDLW